MFELSELSSFDDSLREKSLGDAKIRTCDSIGSHSLYEVSNISLVYMFGSFHMTDLIGICSTDSIYHVFKWKCKLNLHHVPCTFCFFEQNVNEKEQIFCRFCFSCEYTLAIGKSMSKWKQIRVHSPRQSAMSPNEQHIRRHHQFFQ